MRLIRFYLKKAPLYRPHWLGLLAGIAPALGAGLKVADIVTDPYLSLLLPMAGMGLLLHELSLIVHLRGVLRCQKNGIMVRGTLLKKINHHQALWSIAGPDLVYHFKTPTGQIITARETKLLASQTTHLKAGSPVSVAYCPDAPRRCALLLE